MMKKSHVGEKWGMLLIIGEDGFTRNGMRIVRCRCDCGCEKSVYYCHIKDGHTKSCGCYRKDVTQKTHKKHGLTAKSKKLDSIYRRIIDCCYNKYNVEYKYYGGKGITVCSDWLNDERKFFDFAFSNGYKEGLSIDRINSNGNYCPENCRFVSRTINSLRATFKREYGYDPTDEELSETYNKANLTNNE